MLLERFLGSLWIVLLFGPDGTLYESI